MVVSFTDDDGQKDLRQRIAELEGRLRSNQETAQKSWATAIKQIGAVPKFYGLLNGITSAVTGMPTKAYREIQWRKSRRPLRCGHLHRGLLRPAYSTMLTCNNGTDRMGPNRIIATSL
ncbi:hypothetical protein WJX79_000615 [Trebouxia sp. C0005]